MRFDGFVGNAALRQRLSTAFSAGKISHCYLLSGPRGAGKHTLAGIMAAAMQCTGGGDVPCGVCAACRKVASGQHPDVIVVDDAERKTVGVDTVRAARADAFIRPNEGRRKIYLIPRAQDLGPAAQNALLKVLEEPPQYVTFLLLATNADALLATIRSRAVELKLSAPDAREGAAFLQSRVPEADVQSIQAALESGGGWLGQALEHLTGSIWLPETERFAQCFAARDRLGLLRVLLPMEKWKRPELTQALLQWRQLLTAALAAKNGAPASGQLVRQLCAGRTGAQLLAAAQTMHEGVAALEANVSTGSVIGWLTAQLR